jgi:hypothetical protein
MRPVLTARSRDGLLEAVLAQAELGKAVVAAVEFRQALRNRLVFKPVHAPNPRVEPGGGFQVVAP